MPDFNGVLTTEDRTRFDAWSNNNWHMGKCPVCGKQNWALADHVVTPILYNQVGFTQSSGYPQIMIICQECGYILYIAAVTVGIIKE
jgi:hypothetical protein